VWRNDQQARTGTAALRGVPCDVCHGRQKPNRGG
jgi:hypothetical protein